VFANAADGDLVFVVRKVLDHAGFKVEPGAELVEKGELHARAWRHAAGVGREAPAQQIEQRGLAGAVGADDADALAAQDLGAEVADHGGFAGIGEGDLFDLQHLFAGGFGRIELQAAHTVCVRRRLKVSRSSSRAATRPSLRVVRALTPRRIHTSS
jgi:hypothetical protein